MIKKAALFGLAIAILYTLWLKAVVVFSISSIQIPMLPLISNTLIIGIPLYLGMLHIRKRHFKNEMNFSQSFYIGILISILAGMFTYTSLALLESLNILIPSLLADYKTTTLEFAKTIPAADVPAYNKNVDESIQQPYNVAKQNFIVVLLISAFSATILSLFIRNKDTFTEIK
jgi:hypothetical protein